MTAEDRQARLRALYAVLSAPDPSPSGQESDEEWTRWMDRVAADEALAGLVHSGAHGDRFENADLAPHREASERLGSRLDADALAEAFRLLAER
ncbi:hypothetical protein DQ237_06270 [Blastococcus sp. TF02-8]|uniref:hypothetical protein n=1 Tax=Blastococcus sp. TF02-8 TaxID=2250574 RepID=UPI000DEA2796|nr:hypothetical protein [Blastococcus sp. TF02-8]RBY97177.1 hypothetical protein DQ237_06270 [Blastococcus sp. TF02-8]